MNNIAEQIKRALHNGDWKDSGGVISQINRKNVTFKELLDNGALNKKVLSEIEFDDKFIIDRIVEEKLDIKVLEHIIPAAQYQRIYARFLAEKEQEEEAAKAKEREAKAAEIKEHFQKIKDKTYSNNEIRNLVLSGLLSRNEIMKHTYLSDEDMAEIMGDPVDSLLPPPLPPTAAEALLLDDRTDVFTFGVVGSGKSLFLGALFAYAEQRGLYRTEKAHKAAILYTDFLIRAIKSGRPIEGTALDYALYLPVTFKNKEGHAIKKNLWSKPVVKHKYHPFNFIEMSGEHFQDIYTAEHDHIFKWLKDYLFESNNKKIFFFTIDYFIHQSNSEGQLQASQSAQFVNVLNFLQQNKLINGTIAICLLITKWDLCPNPSPEAAKSFLENCYRNLFETCKDLERNNKALDFKIFTFSIGDVRPSNAYTYRPEKSQGVFDWLCDVSYYELRD